MGESLSIAFATSNEGGIVRKASLIVKEHVCVISR